MTKKLYIKPCNNGSAVAYVCDPAFVAHIFSCTPLRLNAMERYFKSLSPVHDTRGMVLSMPPARWVEHAGKRGWEPVMCTS